MGKHVEYDLVIDPFSEITQDPAVESSLDDDGAFFTIQRFDKFLYLKSSTTGLMINDKPCEPGTGVSLSGGDCITLGDVKIDIDGTGNNHDHIEPPRSDVKLPLWQKVRISTVRYANQLPAGATNALIGCLLLAIIGITMTVTMSGAAISSQQAAKSTEDFTELRQFLSAEQFTDVVFEKHPKHLEFIGWVAKDKDMAELQSWLSAVYQDWDYENRVRVISRVESAVSDFLRMNGIQSTAAASRVGELTITLEANSVYSKDEIKNLLQREFTALSVMTVKDGYVDPLGNTETSPVKSLNGFISMVVSSGIAHIVTRDGEVFYVGSSLPDGQVISRIGNGMVHLMNRGVEQTINF